MRKRKYVSLDDAENIDDASRNSEGGGWGFNDSHLKKYLSFNDNHHYYDADDEPITKDDGTIAALIKNKENETEEKGFKLSIETENEEEEEAPIPQCHNIVSTSQIVTSQPSINLQRLADLYPFTTYDRKRFAAITIRLANPHCTCLLFGSGKLVITGSTSFSACIVASHEITRILRRASPRDTFEVTSCTIQNLVGHVSLTPGTTIDLNRLYEKYNEQSTYQRSVFPGLVLRPPRSPIVLLIFTSGRIVCTGGRSYDDIYYGFKAIYSTLKPFIRNATIDTTVVHTKE